MRTIGQAVEYVRTSRCTRCQATEKHSLLLEPAAFHALGRSSIFCASCGCPATLLRVAHAA